MYIYIYIYKYIYTYMVNFCGAAFSVETVISDSTR